MSSSSREEQADNNINAQNDQDNVDTNKQSKSCWQVWKHLILLAIVVLVIVTISAILLFTLPVQSYLNQASIWMNHNYALACFLFMLLGIAFVLLLLPVSIIELFGVFVFGPWIGFIMNISINMISAVIGFFIGLYTCQNYIIQTAKDSSHLMIALKAIQFYPFRAILAIRLLYIPMGLKNYALGATPDVPFWTYVLCTFICTLIFSSIFAIVGATAKSVVDVFKKPTTIELIAVVLGILAIIALVVMVIYTSRRLMNHITDKMGQDGADQSLVQDAEQQEHDAQAENASRLTTAEARV